MPKKPSFFERLTGTVRLDETEEPEKPIRPKKSNLSTDREKSIKKDYLSEEKPAPSKEKAKKEEWLTETEAEGQLTIDVYQTTNDVVIKSTIAGVKAESIDITITNDMVTIKGRREKDEEVKPEDYYYQECYWGPFSRSVILPVDVEADRANANMKNGILTIRLPKVEKIKTKKIIVKSE